MHHDEKPWREQASPEMGREAEMQIWNDASWWCMMSMHHHDASWWCIIMMHHHDATPWCIIMVQHDDSSSWCIMMMHHHDAAWWCIKISLHHNDLSWWCIMMRSHEEGKHRLKWAGKPPFRPSMSGSCMKSRDGAFQTRPSAWKPQQCKNICLDVYYRVGVTLG